MHLHTKGRFNNPVHHIEQLHCYKGNIHTINRTTFPTQLLVHEMTRMVVLATGIVHCSITGVVLLNYKENKISPIWCQQLKCQVNDCA